MVIIHIVMSDASNSPIPPPVATDASSEKEDVVLVHSRNENGDGYKIIRKREDRIEFGELKPMVEGKPILGEIVQLKPRPDNNALYDVEVLLTKPNTSVNMETSLSGPAQVATENYRSNWEKIFKPKKKEIN